MTRFGHNTVRVLATAALLLSVASCGGSSSSAAEGGSCSTVGERQGIENGTLECTDTPDGLVWLRAGGSPEGGGNRRLARVGSECSEDGSFAFGDGMITICDSGAYRYALPDDMPPVPEGGYTERPDWYPTLADIFGPTVDECPSGDVQFTSPVIDDTHITRTIPAGMMIYDHVTPIDHMYIGISSLDTPDGQPRTADAAIVHAPADGTIVEVGTLGEPTSNRVVISHGCGVVSVYMVVNELTGVLAPYAEQAHNNNYVALNVPVKAGDEIARQSLNPMDFNIFDGATWLTGFVNPYSYADGEPWKPYTADPLPYFAPGIGDALLASMQRTIEPQWGVIDRDVPGTAAGSWFLDGTIGYNGYTVDQARNATGMLPGGNLPGKNYYSWNHLSLSPHPVDESAWIFSIGWWQDPDGDPTQLLIDVSGGLPAPNELDVADGVVAYPLSRPKVVQPDGFTHLDGTKAPDGIGYTVVAGPEPLGWALVRVNDDGTLTVEISTDASTSPTDFTDNQRTYHR